MAGWNFTVDSESQKELSDDLYDSALKYDEQIKALYGEFDNLQTSWVGEDYDAFKIGTDGYKVAITDLADGIRMYGEHFSQLSIGTEGLADELIAVIQNLTGSDSGGIGGLNGTDTTRNM